MRSTRDLDGITVDLADQVASVRSPAWPAHLRELCRQLLHPQDKASLTKAHGEVWLLLNTVLVEYGKGVAARLRTISQEDLEDFAAEKALDLLEKIVHGEAEVIDRTTPALARFMSTIARNGLLNLARKARRRVLPWDDERPEWDVGRTGEGQTMGMQASPDSRIERREFAEALRLCAEGLKPRARRIWFLRVFCTMTSKEIASHPEIDLKASHVDVLLQRVRKQIRECMRRKGHEAQDMPPGCFAEMWPLFHKEEALGPEETHV